MFNSFLACSSVYCLILILALSNMKRSAFTETLLQKHAADQKHKADRHDYWYQVDLSKLDEGIREKFIQLNQDQETDAFLENCYANSDSFFWQMWHSVSVPILKIFMTQTNVNGYLDRGSMYVYSTAQFRQLLKIPDTWTAESLLDLGAGDGKVTEKMASHFSQVFATEISSQMVKRLTSKGYTVLDINDWSSRSYDVITCLNLLDRCDKPMTLLRDMKSALKPDGYLIVASVSPYSPYVEVNSSNNYQPTERLTISSRRVEDQICQMVNDVFKPAGFSLHSVSRVPYLCEGDLTTSFYVLDDIIFVLKPHSDD